MGPDPVADSCLQTVRILLPNSRLMETLAVIEPREGPLRESSGTKHEEIRGV